VCKKPEYNCADTIVSFEQVIPRVVECMKRADMDNSLYFMRCTLYTVSDIFSLIDLLASAGIRSGLAFLAGSFGSAILIDGENSLFHVRDSHYKQQCSVNSAPNLYKHLLKNSIIAFENPTIEGGMQTVKIGSKSIDIMMETQVGGFDIVCFLPSDLQGGRVYDELRRIGTIKNIKNTTEKADPNNSYLKMEGAKIVNELMAIDYITPIIAKIRRGNKPSDNEFNELIHMIIPMVDTFFSAGDNWQHIDNKKELDEGVASAIVGDIVSTPNGEELYKTIMRRLSALSGGKRILSTRRYKIKCGDSK
jgi:hypothetical protein